MEYSYEEEEGSDVETDLRPVARRTAKHIAAGEERPRINSSQQTTPTDGYQEISQHFVAIREQSARHAVQMDKQLFCESCHDIVCWLVHNGSFTMQEHKAARQFTDSQMPRWPHQLDLCLDGFESSEWYTNYLINLHHPMHS
ncbi:unnamed protein product [Spodoptera exigua]|nr:unnamed protein product [Spodoptera exigua]